MPRLALALILASFSSLAHANVPAFQSSMATAYPFSTQMSQARHDQAIGMAPCLLRQTDSGDASLAPKHRAPQTEASA